MSTPLHTNTSTSNSDQEIDCPPHSIQILPIYNNTIVKGFNQMAPPVRIITVALDMSKAFDTINSHTPIRKLLQTNIPGTLIKSLANYIKGRKANTTYRNHTSRQRQLKASFHQHYLTFTFQTYHHPVHRFRSWPTQMTSPSYTHTQARVQPRNTYTTIPTSSVCLDKTKQSHTKSRQNNFHSVHQTLQNIRAIWT